MLFETVRFVKLCLKYMHMLVNNWMQHIYIQLGFRSVHLKSKHVLSYLFWPCLWLHVTPE